MDNKKDVESLISELGDREADVRDNAFHELEKIGGSAVRPLIDTLRHKNIIVRRYAAEILGKMRSELAIKSLIEVFKDEDPVICKRAKYSLWLIGQPAVEYLIRELDNSNWRVRMWSAVTIGEITYQRVTDPPRLIHDPSAIFILESRRSDVDIATVRKMSIKKLRVCTFKDENENVRKYAYWALEKLE
jgi:HEAT repeat protein